MMTILGWILLVAGGVAAALVFLGNAPEFLLNLPVPFWGWCLMAVGGALLVYLNRRPGN